MRPSPGALLGCAATARASSSTARERRLPDQIRAPINRPCPDGPGAADALAVARLGELRGRFAFHGGGEGAEKVPVALAGLEE